MEDENKQESHGDYNYRRKRRYKDIMSSVEKHPSPLKPKEEHVKKFEERSDNIISIIKSCEYLKDEYHYP